ncbi:Fc receptor-like protein 5 [Engraulis encrasicolus]|uniref:Fc receptor-like protein 5 n=1 Tax=Engraulis encrasicolus TaxID=184585 RepID=UPI002FCF6625
MGSTERLCLIVVILYISQTVARGGPGSVSVVLRGPEYAYLNTKIRLSCEILGSPPPSATCQFMKVKNISLTTPQKSSSPPQPFLHDLKVMTKSTGEYYCIMTTLGKTVTSNILHLYVVIPVSGASLRSVPSPPTEFKGSSMALFCDVQKGSHLSYTWFHNRIKVTAPSSVTYNLSGNSLTVDRLRNLHAGTYYCSAWNDIGLNPRYSSSNEIQVAVKDYLTVPNLSVTLFKENSKYYANISCESAQGTVPVTFVLLLSGREADRQITNSLSAWFRVALVVGMETVTAQCRAETSYRQLNSDTRNIEMVSVGGPLHLHIDYLYNINWEVVAVRLECHISRGTFPSYLWLHNNSFMTQRSCSTISNDLQCHVLLLTDVTPVHFGHYQCHVRDSFEENSSWLQSDVVLVEGADFPGNVIEVIAVAFCCFLMLAMITSLLCLLWLSGSAVQPQHMAASEHHR